MSSLPDAIREREARLQEWARKTATAPDDHTIVVPPEFNRDEAMQALEIEIARGLLLERAARAEQALVTHYGVTPGQGRNESDARTNTARLVLVAILAALAAVGVVSCAMGG